MVTAERPVEQSLQAHPSMSTLLPLYPVVRSQMPYRTSARSHQPGEPDWRPFRYWHVRDRRARRQLCPEYVHPKEAVEIRALSLRCIDVNREPLI